MASGRTAGELPNRRDYDPAMSIERAEAVLTDPQRSLEVDTILRRTDDGFRAASSRGSVEFRRIDNGSNADD